jgi:hypothetical protein
MKINMKSVYKESEVITDDRCGYGIVTDKNIFVIVVQTDSEDEYIYEIVAAFPSFIDTIVYLNKLISKNI